jgi:hypothetical protein
MLLENLRDEKPESGGVPHHLIDAIPTQTITPEHLESLGVDSSDKTCVICMEDFQVGQVQ